MNAWVITGMVIAAGVLPCAWMSLRGSPERRLVGMQMTNLLLCLALVMFSVGWGNDVYIDLPLTLAVMSFGGGLVFARFLEKHL